MKVSEVTIIMVPGYAEFEKENWMSRWEAKLSTAKIIPQDWSKESPEDLLSPIKNAIASAEKPVVLVAHCLGVLTSLIAAQDDISKIKGGFFVAPSEKEKAATENKLLEQFSWPEKKLPFPSFVIASSSDPFVTIEEAKRLSSLWGSLFLEAGDSGHLDESSGHGPWPEGLLVFSKFLSSL